MIDSLGDRMKSFYEGVTKTTLVRRMPVIVRLNGKAFHTFCHKFKKPFDDTITNAMDAACYKLLKEVQNCKFIYSQSDEISLLLIDYNELETDAWFGNDIQKIVSVSSSIATVGFNQHIITSQPDVKQWALFDSRTFNIPREEVANYFIWRQQDCLRNSVSVTAQSMFSSKQLHGKNTPTMKEMMKKKGFSWETDLPTMYRNGRIFLKDTLGSCCLVPYLFKDNRDLIERHVYPEEYSPTGK
jgi:tRNA(His) guanylyltransferase